MKRAIIIHGMPDKEEYFDIKSKSPSNSHWIPWVKQQLENNNISTDTPEMPSPYEPKYQEWADILDRTHVDKDTILIGHSGGAGFLLRYILENNIEVGDVYLIAPWLDLERSLITNFFDFKLDESILAKANSFNILYSVDDDATILNSVNNIINILPNINIHKFEDKGHFTFGDMETEQFPELLTLILNANKK
jgi:predicted alpha/beta hydrolase family esterase